MGLRVVSAILLHLDLPTNPRPLSPARGLPQSDLLTQSLPDDFDQSLPDDLDPQALGRSPDPPALASSA
jgi:hypothetical protein